MSPVSSRAKYLRGALIGLCSAIVSAAAHGLAGGELPSGAAMILLALAGTVAGGLAGTVGSHTGPARSVVVLAWLTFGQAAGHLMLTAAGCHGHLGLAVSPAMLAAHGAGAVVCALLIAAAEHLYVVCASVLAWLIVFAAHRLEPQAAARPRWANPPALQPLLLGSGCGTRGPPRLSAAFA